MSELTLEQVKAVVDYGDLPQSLVNGWIGELFGSEIARAALRELATAGELKFGSQTDRSTPTS